MRDITEDPRYCSVDPITLGALAIGGLAAGGIASATQTGGAAPTPKPPPAQAPAQQAPLPKPQQQQQSFIGGVPAPPPSTGQKTLLGQ